MIAAIKFLSTPSARRATEHKWEYMDQNRISIHALREEGDGRGSGTSRTLSISIHALREEGDSMAQVNRAAHTGFLSTPSARRATTAFAAPLLRGRNFYPRPPRGGRLQAAELMPYLHQISIHALREEGDPYTLQGAWRNWNFYPRPPRGGRLQQAQPQRPQPIFLSTPSARRATHRVYLDGNAVAHFYPRPPRGGRPFLGVVPEFVLGISIHALREEGDFRQRPFQL